MFRIIIIGCLLLYATVPAASAARTIHVYVALCDNEHQGIVPVPEAIGNGKDPLRNLYWGAGYGVKTYFSRSKQWKLLKTWKNPETHVLERLLFQHATASVFLVADAYDGEQIRPCIQACFNALAGNAAGSITWQGQQLGTGGAADLVAYVGHDGLMEFSVAPPAPQRDVPTKDAIVLACYSKAYFSAGLKKVGARPLVLTTGLMAPEAYTLEEAVNAWVERKSPAVVAQRAAAAYHKYQKCGLRAAQRLLVAGY